MEPVAEVDLKAEPVELSTQYKILQSICVVTPQETQIKLESKLEPEPQIELAENFFNLYNVDLDASPPRIAVSSKDMSTAIRENVIFFSPREQM